MAARCLDTLGADASKIRTQVIRMVGESQEAVAAGPAGGQGSNKTPTLEEYGTNLTAQAESVRFWPHAVIAFVSQGKPPSWEEYHITHVVIFNMAST